MGFYNLEKLREEALKTVNGFKPLHELEINGEKQDDEDTDYTGDDDNDPDTPENGVEEPEADYTSPEGDDTDDETGAEPQAGTGSDADVPDDATTGEGDGGQGTEGDGDAGGEEGGDDGSESVGQDNAVDAEETPDEADYTIPDDAGPEAQSAEGEDPGAANDVEADYTGDDGGDTGEEADYTTDGEETGSSDAETGGGDTSVPDAGADQDATADTDYTQDDGGDAEAGDGAGAEGDTTDTDDGSSGASINDELKTAEDQLMADLSDEQKQIQSDELRKNFLDLYNTVLDVIDKVNNIHKEESTLQVFEFISSQLLILKDIINTNITRSFDTKTYIENNVDYQHCLAILNSVKLMIDETNKKSQKAKEE